MNLLFSTQGEIGRKQFWIGFLILIGIGLLLGLATAPLALSGSRLTDWLSLSFGLLLLFPAVALSMKRLRDRGRQNLMPWLVAYFAPGFAFNLCQALGIGFVQQTIGGIDVSQPTAVGWLLTVAVLIAFATAVVDLGFRKGGSAKRDRMPHSDG